MLWCISESNWSPSRSHLGIVFTRRHWAPACSSHRVKVQWVKLSPGWCCPVVIFQEALSGSLTGRWMTCVQTLGLCTDLLYFPDGSQPFPYYQAGKEVWIYIYLPRHTSVSSPAFSLYVQWNNSLWVSRVDRCQVYGELPWSFCTHWQPQCSCVFPSLLLVSKP